MTPPIPKWSLEEEPQDDSWPAIGQTYHGDGLAVEGQGVLLNRDEFLLVVHMSPLSRACTVHAILFAPACRIGPFVIRPLLCLSPLPRRHQHRL